LIDEDLKGVVTLQTTSPDYLSDDGESGLEAGAITSLHKVIKLLSEWNPLEREP
jgi:hypothetical protein